MDTLQQKINTLRGWIKESDRIVFFGGAGVSTESGIPDFRSVDGLYHQKFDKPPETILSHSYYKRRTKEFYRFYKEKMLYPDAKPGPAHLALAELERAGKLSAVVTQNVDGLHQAAGSKRVYELHGSVHRNYCTRCGSFYSLADLLADTSPDGIPRCKEPGCKGIVKPDVVLYEEGLDQRTINSALNAIAEADMLIIGGTSLVVYPAASLIRYYTGDKLVLINKSDTPQDDLADLLIRAPLGEVLSAAVTAVF